MLLQGEKHERTHMRHGSVPLARAKIAYEISPFDRPEKKIPIDNPQHTIGNRQDAVGNFPSGVVNSRKARPNLELMQHALLRKERGRALQLENTRSTRAATPQSGHSTPDGAHPTLQFRDVSSL